MTTARAMFAKLGYANTPTEEIVRRARVTRGALYHHFRGKADLFKAVLIEEQARLAALVGEVGAKQSDPWSALTASCRAFLDACVDPVVQKIVLVDGPAVLGWDAWREIDANFYKAGVKAAIQAAIDANLISPQPVEALAEILMSALDGAAMMIAHAPDVEATRRAVDGIVDRLFEGFRSHPANANGRRP
ncbi:MAG TPA: TetR/AcrR family transcriptional regulator [Candidatus Binataceae bacterium]|nr:TetR/AcrR family transcriptional regulator [Candidatus Binataceae bacterium]